uniref:CCD97-like C-terminal domain-containing protein n=1 Tax=Mycena chlorophos TaxID=658473 RepID=A0ABQ0LGZ7_MYCCL|nr:predicted protein [Mycena chlorophos]
MSTPTPVAWARYTLKPPRRSSLRTRTTTRRPQRGDHNAETMAVIAFENAIAAKDAAKGTPEGGWHELAVSSLIVGPVGVQADVSQSADDDDETRESQVQAGIFPPAQAPVVESPTNNATTITAPHIEIPNPLPNYTIRNRHQWLLQRQREVEFFKSIIRPFVPQQEEPVPMSPLEAVIRDPVKAVAIQESLSVHIARIKAERERRAARDAAMFVPVGGSVSDNEDDGEGWDDEGSEAESSSSEQDGENTVKGQDHEHGAIVRPKRQPLADLPVPTIKVDRELLSPEEEEDENDPGFVVFMDSATADIRAAKKEAFAIAGGFPWNFGAGGPLKRHFDDADLDATAFGRVFADITHKVVVDDSAVDEDGERPAKRRCLDEVEGKEDGVMNLLEFCNYDGDEEWLEDEAQDGQGLPVRALRDMTDGDMSMEVDRWVRLSARSPVLEGKENGGADEEVEVEVEAEAEVEENPEDGHDFVVYEGPVVDEEVEEEEVEDGKLSSDEEENDENAS